MKLGLIYHQLLPAGGMERYLLEFARRMGVAGHELRYVATRTSPDVAKELPGEVVLLSRPPLLPSLQLWDFDRRAAAMGTRLGVDVTIGYGRTTVQDVHRAGGGCHAHYSRLLPFWKRYRVKNLLELQLEKRLYSGGRTRHFVTNSDRVAAQLQGRYLTPPGQFTTIHTAVEQTFFKPAMHRGVERDLMCRDLETDPAKKVLLFVSLNHRRKGLDALLKALRQVPDAVLWIVGKPLSRRHESQIEALGLGDRIRKVPVTSSLVRLYQTADWFVHPTLYDACANTVLQSMACGLPGLISVRDGAVDHIEHGRNGFMLYHPEDSDGLAEAIGGVLAIEEEQRAAMGRAAMERMGRLTWERHLEQWETLLAGLKASPGLAQES